MDYQLLIDRFGTAQGPMQRRLHEALRAAIRAGALAPGTRLQASRVLARELGVARNTVLYAYEQLATEGLIEPDRRGSRVSHLLATPPTKAHPAAAAKGMSTLQPGALSRRAQATLATGPVLETTAAFAPGVPALDEFPVVLWRRLLERSWRGLGTQQLNYADPAGEPALRAAIADHLRASRGVQCEVEQVFVTDGTQASLDLCARAFADAGDKVWLESPGYAGAETALRAAQLKLIGIAVDEQGMAPRPDDWRRHAPRLIYTTPSHQYPTGAVMSLERRLQMLAHARDAGALIIEDDYDSEFRHDGPPLPAMQGLQADAPVLYLGTFSKTLFPGLRIGFVAVPAKLCEPLSRLLARAQPRGRTADQLALAEFLRNGHFGLHLRRMRRLYRQRRDALVLALERELGGLATVHGDRAGMHLALRFEQPGMNDLAVSQRALQAGIVVPALSELAVGARAQDWRGLMLGYAQVPAECMDTLVQTLVGLMREAAVAR